MRVALGYAFLVLVPVAPAQAHDAYDWIRRGAYLGVDGTRCCGQNDCLPIAPDRVHATPHGFALRDHGMIVPYRQARPSEDGKYWLCKTEEQTMRCFFVPSPAM